MSRLRLADQGWPSSGEPGRPASAEATAVRRSFSEGGSVGEASRWRRFARFNAVGALGIGVQLTVLWVLVDVGRVAYLPGTIGAVSAAVVHNFVWHLRWTWRDRPTDITGAVGAFLRFVLANGAVSFVGNAAIMTMLVGGMGLHPVGANMIAIASCGLVNFWLGDAVVFPRSWEIIN